MIKVKYNTPIEVTQEQYNFISANYSWIAAYAIVQGKYFIKVLFMPCKNKIKNYLTKTTNHEKN